MKKLIRYLPHRPGHTRDDEVIDAEEYERKQADQPDHRSLFEILLKRIPVLLRNDIIFIVVPDRLHTEEQCRQRRPYRKKRQGEQAEQHIAQEDIRQFPEIIHQRAVHIKQTHNRLLQYRIFT